MVARAQATVETVIKVSGNKHAEDVKAEKAAEKLEAEKEKEAERQTAATLPPAAPPPPETVVESIIHHSWGHLSADPKDIPVVRLSPALCSVAFGDGLLWSFENRLGGEGLRNAGPSGSPPPLPRCTTRWWQTQLM